MSAEQLYQPQTIIDCSHLGRKTTGIERITEELFSEADLPRANAVRLRANSIYGMLFQQWIGIIWAAFRHPNCVIITPGFPPSMLATFLLKGRLIPYIHDVFLLTRQHELNRRAKYYMRPSFSYAVKTLPCFFVNSQKTKQDLQRFCREDAAIILFRPQVRNVFSLTPQWQRYQQTDISQLKIVMLGTVEPRKNYAGALAIFSVLQSLLGRRIELHIIGRIGWGPDAERITAASGVVCHGYLATEQIRQLIYDADLYLSTSHDEGLGLPLLELQYSGIAVVASNIPVFAEVLQQSGLLIDANNAAQAAADILALFQDPARLQQQTALALDNVQRWNALAADDKTQAQSFLRR